MPKSMTSDVIWIQVRLKTNSYQVEKLEEGMWFINSLYPGTDREFVELWELAEDVPDEDFDDFIARNGYPVEVLFTMEMQNPDEPDDIVVFAENIGWYFDVETEEMQIASLQMMNIIINDYDGNVFLLIDEFLYDDGDEVVPEMENNLVIFTFPFEEEVEEIED
jgi:hypothetical protein